jgi:Zn ribbon nucleic-acid-binding protein
MPLLEEGPIVRGRACPACHGGHLNLLLVTHESLFIRCVTCGCVWYELDRRMRTRVRVPKQTAEPTLH